MPSGGIRPGGPGRHQPAEAGQGQVGRMPSLTVKQPRHFGGTGSVGSSAFFWITASRVRWIFAYSLFDTT